MNHYPVVQPWDDVDIGHRVKMVQEWEQAAFARDERIKQVEVSLSDAAKVVMIVRPDGRLIEDWRPMTRASLRCTAEALDPMASQSAKPMGTTWLAVQDSSTSTMSAKHSS